MDDLDDVDDLDYDEPEEEPVRPARSSRRNTTSKSRSSKEYADRYGSRSSSRSRLSDEERARRRAERFSEDLDENEDFRTDDDVDEYLEARRARRQQKSTARWDVRKIVGLAAAAVAIIALIGFGIHAIRNRNAATTRLTPGGVEENQNQEMNPSEIETEESLQLNAMPEINSLVKSYYAALQNANLNQMKTLVTSTDDFSLEKLEKKAQYVEGYNNLQCYTHSGLKADEILTLVSYEMKFRNITTTAPGLNYFFMQKNADGKYVIVSKNTEAQEAFVKKVEQNADVQNLIKEVDSRLQRAIEADSSLRDLVDFIKDTSTTKETTAPETQAPRNSGYDDEGFEIRNETIEALDNVNVRAWAARDADWIGVLEGGQQAKRIGYTEDWSKIEFNGQIGYCVSEYVSTYLYSNQ